MAKSKGTRVKFSGKRTAGAKAKGGKKSRGGSGSKKNDWRKYVEGSNEPIPD